MAEALLGVVTEAVLTKVISLASERISRALGVKEDLQSLAKQLELIQALLSDAESKSTTNNAIEVWLQELKDVAADADDLLDEFAYEVQSKKLEKGKKNEVRSCFCFSNALGFRFNMASKIEKINLQMNEILERAKLIGLVPIEIINSPNDPRKVPLTDPFVDDSKICGRDDDVSEILRQLTCPNDEQNLSVIGIVGMGGQGKTTLAQLLLKNDAVKKHFQERVWTCVSEDFDVDRVLKDMLQSLTGEASQLTNREAIVKRLSKELQGKRFLLVLDDVWSENSQLWEHMNNCLQEIGGSKGSKIIVTTRNEALVTIMNGFVYHLGVLSGKASQELFEKMAFGNGRVAKTPQLVKIGEKIVARCGGVPLALKSIGGLMSSRRDELEWLKIEESSIWSTLGGVRSAIKLSFDHLPSLSLKQCFAYCSIFPKDSVIEKNDTIQQWMAHGLLNPSRGSCLEMEVIGNNYFNILLQRSLLQEPEFDMYGNTKSCKMHDLVHDFASEASKGHCLTAGVGDLSDNINKVVHLSIFQDGSNDLNISRTNLTRLRTLHFSGANFLVNCKSEHLRVLTVVDWRMEELPTSIAKMKHLRYLDISRTSIRALPEFISQLHNLQTLRLSFVPNSPKDFFRLVNLRHLCINNKYVSSDYPILPLVAGIGELTSLRTLNRFPVTKDAGCRIEELCNLNHLEGSLTIVGLENVANGDDARRANLLRKRNIGSLELLWSNTYRQGPNNDESILEDLQPHPCLEGLKIESFQGNSLPSWILQLRNLMHLELTKLGNCERIPPLGHLPFLSILRIHNMESVTCVSNDFYGWPNVARADSNQSSAVVFPSLKELNFSGMSSLKEWSDMVPPSYISSVELFPSLKNFQISFCPCLARLPEGLFSTSKGLETLWFRLCNELVSIPNLSNLHSLKYMYIFYCWNFSALPRGITACRSLQTLYITYPANLVESLFHNLTNLRSLTLKLSDNNIIDHHHVPTEPFSNTTEGDIQGNEGPFSVLEYLALFGMFQLKSLPEQIQFLTALRDLELNKFEGLETLPEWLGNFHSLESLGLSYCYSLANFPSMQVMRGLTKLKFLKIFFCPILKRRCERETGEEWYKIAHIPSISIT